MRTHFKKIHLLIGLAGVFFFLFTGYYMRVHLPEMHLEGHDRLRFSIRGNHIYILMSALLNLALGSCLRVSEVKWRAVLQTCGSLLVLLTPVLLAVAFFYEPKDGLDRPVSLSAMIAALAGTSFHALSRVKHGSENEQPRRMAAQSAAGVSGGSSGAASSGVT